MATRDLFSSEAERPEVVSPEDIEAMARGERGLAGLLRAARIGAGLALDAVGVPRLRAIEAGTERASPETVRRIAAVTGADLVALLSAWDEGLSAGERVRLEEGRTMVGEAIQAGAGSCPCCGQEVKAREVALSAKLGEVVRGLVRGYRGGPVTLEAGVSLARDAALWDLALPVSGAAFLPTEQARVFMRGELRLPRRLIVWQGKIIRQAGKPTAWGDLKVPPERVTEALSLL
ncbi:MAG: hypothetical protein VW516_13025 [Rhodospirillaceae bacterium]